MSKELKRGDIIKYCPINWDAARIDNPHIREYRRALLDEWLSFEGIATQKEKDDVFTIVENFKHGAFGHLLLIQLTNKTIRGRGGAWNIPIEGARLKNQGGIAKLLYGATFKMKGGGDGYKI